MRLLLVDDDPLFLQALSDSIFLRARKIAVETAPSGPSALRILATDPFDVVVSDILMSDMNGYELTQEIRKSWPDMAVVLISGNPDQESRALNSGANAFLPKPIDRDQFVETLRRVAGTSENHQ
jgi:CheY-like chemotaxis protein